MVGVAMILVAWTATLIDAWPVLVARLSVLNWISAVAIHGVALIVAVSLYLQCRKGAVPTGPDVLRVFALWSLTWMLDGSLFAKIAR